MRGLRIWVGTRIMMANEGFLPWETLAARMKELGGLIDVRDATAVRAILTELVPEYKAGALKDWVNASEMRGEAAGISELNGRRGGESAIATPAEMGRKATHPAAFS